MDGCAEGGQVFRAANVAVLQHCDKIYGLQVVGLGLDWGGRPGVKLRYCPACILRVLIGRSLGKYAGMEIVCLIMKESIRIFDNF